MALSMTRAIVATRAAVGVTCWAIPVVISRLFGIDIREDRSGKFYLRVAGTRDIALAVASATTTGASLAQVLRDAAACDIADMVATAITRRQGNVSRSSTALWLAGCGACLAMTIGAHNELRRAHRARRRRELSRIQSGPVTTPKLEKGQGGDYLAVQPA
jgi:hypothetical protein